MSESSSELEQGLDPSLVPVCAIGASAGAVTALRTFFRHVQPDLNLAYVVIVHLSPDQPSVLSEILASCTSMRVQQVADGPTLVANCVYVIPPDRELVISGNHISARPFSQPRGQRAPIDMFFRSIAAARGDGCAVILTGSGADGSQGVRAIKEAGGIIFVQDPSEAEFPMMPQNAIATGVADFIAPVADLAKSLAEVAKSKEAIRSLNVDSASNELRRILGFLRTRTGHDFSSYKRATVMRRVGRRMQVAQRESLAAYAEHVRDTPEEAKELFSDLLISVTMFFRDPRAFQTLAEQALPHIFEDVDADTGIRAWAVGCATGEEAYSLAILLFEAAAARKMTLPIQIFATDLDEGALATAREGRYPRTIEADISEERLRRWFSLDGSHYRVRQELRDVVLFATHSALKDPPFMRLDLITCRNLLIYLDRPLQRQLATVFHYGLRPNRFLFLGSAETMDTASEFFTTIDREARIYQARAHRERILPQLPPFPDSRHTWPPERRRAAGRDEQERNSAYAHVAALERSAPPSVLVDDMQRIVNLSPSAGRFIQPSGGPFTTEIASMVRPELRLDLKIALERAIGLQQATLTLPAIVAFDDMPRRVGMHVLPVVGDQAAAVQVLVLFLDGGPLEPGEVHDARELAGKPDETRRLYEELKIAHERLNASRHDHDLAIQDLRAANEELQSINEEYRSTAEELETSKEELQSINEELQTVNAELKSKLEHISSALNDLQNLTSATEIGTLFLDPELRIRMFTPPVAELFNICDNDIGRTITSFTHQMRYQGLELDARRVLRDLAPFENVVESTGGRFYMMRIRPYRTLEDRIQGLVITFVDVRARLQAEQELRASEERYRTLFNSIDEAFSVIEVLFDAEQRPVDFRYIDVNAAFERQTGLADVVGKTMRALVPGFEDSWFEILGRVAVSRQAERFENRAAALNRYYEVFAFPAGEPGERTVGILFNDISKRKEAEMHLRLMVNELNHRVKNTLAVVQAIAQQSFKHEPAAQGPRRMFEGRLASLATAHSLLTRSHWEKASLQDVVQAVVRSCSARAERIAIRGPAVNLSPAEAVSVSMALHELCVNATKYGALSNESGRIDVSWQLGGDAGRQLRLTWRELDGPRVPTPTHRGFGSVMVEDALAYELSGKARIEYLPNGVVCTIEAPLSMPQPVAQ